MTDHVRHELAPSSLLPASLHTAPQAHNLWHVVDGRMRGRWRLALAAGLVLALGLSSAAYFLTEPKYESSGSIQIKSYLQPIIDDTFENGSIPLYQNYVQTQVALIQSRPVLEQALQDEIMTLVPWARQPNALNLLAGGLEVETQRGSELVRISFRADNAREAQAVVKAVIGAYDDRYLRGTMGDRSDIQGILNTEQTQLNGQQEAKREQLRELIKLSPTGGDAPDRYNPGKQVRIDEIEVSLSDLREQLAQDAGVGAVIEPALVDLLAFDPALELRASELAAAVLVLEKVHQGGLLPGHHAYRRAVKDLEYAERRYEEQHAVARAGWLEALRTGALADAPRGPEEIEAQIARLEGQREAYRLDIQRAIADHQRKLELETDERGISESLAAVKARLTALRVEGQGVGSSRIVVIDSGDLPTAPSQDRRRKLAALGGAGGLALSLGFFFLLGAIDRRTFSVVQLRDAEHGLRCLGVLPDLSHSRLDPESCAVAAHCVHQIRNHIEAIRPGDRSIVLAVSSAYQGDGKTSIVLALGGSYAAAGYRTVLVDCDLVGRSLTAQLGRSGLAGLREALKERRLNGQVVAAGTPNLSVLPVGLDAAFGAEVIRRADIEAVFRQLRERFDVIIVDTGPMGSLEGLPVASAADGVVLAVRRGRRQPRVEECVASLRGAGANCLGIILNCAARSDCDRYVSKSTVSAAAADSRDRGAAAALVQAMNLASSPRAPGTGAPRGDSEGTLR